MVALATTIEDPTLAAVDAAVERIAATEQARPYLGASAIGRECERQLWYGFRWCARETFKADTLYRFEDGHRTEYLRAARLRLVPGIELHTIDGTGRQFGVSYAAGHFRGHLDGAIRGLVQAPVTWHVWEGKAVGEDKQAKLAKLKAVDEKSALEQWDPVYYAQAQVYMQLTGMTRHYLTADSPGGRTCVSVRTDHSPTYAPQLLVKAERIIFSAEPRPKLSSDPSFYQCKWCPAQQVCHGRKLPPVNCRTCLHATPEDDGDGRWTCALRKVDLTVEQQRAGCHGHRYIPALISWARPVDASTAANWVEYRTDAGAVFRNGDPGQDCYSSAELRDLDPDQLRAPAAVAPAAAPVAPAWSMGGMQFGGGR